jgi:hypothetical protein
MRTVCSRNVLGTGWGLDFGHCCEREPERAAGADRPVPVGVSADCARGRRGDFAAARDRLAARCPRTPVHVFKPAPRAAARLAVRARGNGRCAAAAWKSGRLAAARVRVLPRAGLRRGDVLGAPLPARTYQSAARPARRLLRADLDTDHRSAATPDRASRTGRCRRDAGGRPSGRTSA